MPPQSLQIQGVLRTEQRHRGTDQATTDQTRPGETIDNRSIISYQYILQPLQVGVAGVVDSFLQYELPTVLHGKLQYTPERPERRVESTDRPQHITQHCLTKRYSTLLHLLQLPHSISISRYSLSVHAVRLPAVKIGFARHAVRKQ
jgi:hypothetical protein